MRINEKNKNLEKSIRQVYKKIFKIVAYYVTMLILRAQI